MWNVVNWSLVIIAYILKKSSPVACRSTNKTGSIFCCEFVLLSIATWLLKSRVCAKQWLPDLAIAVVVIDPTGFLGKGKTEIPHLPLLIGHSVCLVHILTGWRRQLQLGTVGLLLWPLSSTEIVAVKYITKPNHSTASKQCSQSYKVHLVCTSVWHKSCWPVKVSGVHKIHYWCFELLTGKGLEKAFRSS